MTSLQRLKRTEYCGKISKTLEGQNVTVMGWVDSRRDHGSLVFLDLRDREGVVQIVLDPKRPGCESANHLKPEFVLCIQGVVRARPQGMVNAKILSGEIEIEADKCVVLNESQTLPFQIDDPQVNESLRLKYRYLDLRSPTLQKNLIMRHKVNQHVRQYLSDQNFLEVETPILYKSTPEGARDYLVPSRVNLGEFFALPQSPQTLKQLLMIAGYDRYFQIARCFRDEDLRADRQPEFSQIDIEMSFVDEEDLMQVNEQMLKSIWKKFKNIDIGTVPRITFAEAMNRYGNDKPDLRFGLELEDVGNLVQGTGFRAFDEVISKKGAIKCLRVPKTAGQSRSFFDRYTDIARQFGAKGLIYIKWTDAGEIQSPVSKFLKEDILQKILQKAKCEKGDVAFVIADQFEIACAALSALRLEVGREFKLIDESVDKFAWVVDFPLFEYSPEEGRWAARHHLFTSPKDEHARTLIEQRENEYGGLLAKAYDLVCNGYEIAGGSIRIFREDVQAAMFKALGLKPEQAQQKFGYFLEALKFGTPPHGGIAWGMDRLVMILCGTDAIREVIAFPKTAKATCLMSGAPTSVEFTQLNEIGVRLSPAAEKRIQELK